MDFVKSHFGKMNLWPVATANPPKSDDKYAQKSVQLVRGSYFRSDYFQNPYFSTEFLWVKAKWPEIKAKQKVVKNYFTCVWSSKWKFSLNFWGSETFHSFFQDKTSDTAFLLIHGPNNKNVSLKVKNKNQKNSNDSWRRKLTLNDAK